jgi:hypothetical protein
VPSIVYSSGVQEAPAYQNGTLINRAEVELVFWGTGWNANAANMTMRTNIVSAVRTILNTNYLSALTQYSQGGAKNTISGTGILDQTITVTSTQPPANPTSAQAGTAATTMLNANFGMMINGATLPLPYPDRNPLNAGNPNLYSYFYYVIPQPGSSITDAGAFHNSSLYAGTATYYYGYTRNNGPGGFGSALDLMTSSFSHELVEAITDPVPGGGWVIPPPANYTFGGQPANSGEMSDPLVRNGNPGFVAGPLLNYRITDGVAVPGVIVQSYWSSNSVYRADPNNPVMGASVVPVTGQTQDFYVGSNLTANPGAVLTVLGDQLPNVNDTIALDVGANNGIMAGLNADTALFEPGRMSFHAGGLVLNSVVVLNRTGMDVVNVNATKFGIPTTITSNGATTVNIGKNGNAQNVRGNVTIGNAVANGTTVVADDSNDPNVRGVTIDATQITGLAPGVIRYAQAALASLTVSLGSGGNFVSVANTPNNPAGVTTTLNSGTAADIVAVLNTTGPLVVNGQDGRDTVNIGNAGNAQGIMGTVNVTNAASFTALTVDDPADAAARIVVINAGSITGLAPAAINYVGADLSSLTIKGGSGGNMFTVVNTPDSALGVTTTLESGTGVDTVNVQATTGALAINGQNGADTVTIGNAGNVQGVMGAVTVSNDLGTTALTVDDSADAAGRMGTIGAAAITGLAPAAINYVANDLSSLTVNGGTGGNIFTVANTPGNAGGLTTTLNSGTGADTVTVQKTTGPLVVNGQDGADAVTIGDAGSVRGIVAPVTVTNALNFTDLTVDDSADAGARMATITPAAVTGLAPAAINYVQADLSALTVNGGTGGNVFTVTNTPDSILGVTTTLNSGAGVDTVNVQNTTGSLAINGNNGRDNVTISDAGSVQGIMGAVTVSNTLSFTALTVDDSADAAARMVTINAGAITGLAPAAINYVGTDLRALTIKGGTGGNNFTVANTPDSLVGVTTTLNSGSGADTVTVQATTGALTINGQNGADTVTIGNAGTVQGVMGAVTVTNIFGLTALTVDDSADAGARIARITNAAITGLAPAAINYVAADLSSLTINGGTGGNTFTVASTPSNAFGLSTTLNSGTGADTVTVQTTTGPLTVNGQDGRDTVTIGNAGNTQGIRGAVSVTNAASFTALTVDDSADAVSRTATINVGAVLGLSPAAINYVQADLSSLTVNGGTRGNRFTVINTPNSAIGPTTTLNSGTGVDLVLVRATTGVLNVNGQNGSDVVTISNAGSVQGIMGTVTVSNTRGFSILTVDDSTDGVARTPTINAGSLTGLAPATINYVANDLQSLTVNGGPAGNTFTVAGTPSNAFGVVSTVLNSGAGNDSVSVNTTAANSTLTVNTLGGVNVVNVGSAAPGGGGNVNGIQGVTAVNGAGGATQLNFNDDGNAGGTTYAITGISIARTGMAGVLYANLAALVVNAGTGGNVINVLGTALGTPTTVNAGTTGDTINVGNVLNSLDSVLGPLAVNGRGPAVLNVNDFGNLRNDNYVVTATTVTRLFMAGIAYTGVAGLTLNAGAGSSLFSVLSTFPTTLTTINTGAGNDVVAMGGPQGLDNITGPIAVHSAGTLALIFNDQGDPRNDPYTVTATNLSRPGFTFNYIANSITLNAGHGSSVFSIQGTAAGTTTTINTGGGTDLVNVGGPQGLDNIAGPLAINGQNSVLTLNYNDQPDPRNDPYSLSATTLTRPGFSSAFSHVKTLTLNAGPGSSLFTVLGVLPTTATTINTGAGNDTVALGGPQGLDNIAGPIAIHSAGTLALVFNDQGDPRNETYTVTSTKVSRTGFSFIYVANSVTLNGGPGNSVFNVLSTKATTTTAVNPGAGQNTVNIGGTHGLTDIAGPLSISGSGTLALNFNDQPDTKNETYTLTSSSLSRAGFSFNYVNINALTLNAGSGKNTLKLQGTASGTATTVNAGAGNDTITVGDASNTLAGIQGALTINGQAGTNSLTINDQGTSTGKTYTFTASTLARTGAATITYGTVQSLTLNAAAGGNTINVQGTVSATPTTVNGGSGNDTINVGSTSNTLSGIQGALTINGQAGTNSLTVSDQGATTGQTYTLAATTMARSGSATITFGTVSSLTLNAGSGGNTINIQGTAASTSVAVNTGTGTNTTNAGSAANMLAGVQSALTVTGQGTDTLNINDQGTAAGQTYTITSTTVARTGGPTITYAGTASLTLNGAAGGNTFDVQSTGAATPVTIAGGSGTNSLAGSSSANNWAITGSNSGTLSGTAVPSTVSFSSIQNLTGGAGADTFTFADGQAVAGNIDGGAGVNTLDFSAYTSNVIVDLPASTSTGVGGAVSQIQNVTGGSGPGYNILVGNGGNTLIAGSTRSLLIAGATSSTLMGGSADDILIGGTTQYDTNLTALMDIMAEWTRTDETYSTRVANIMNGGGLNGTFMLNTSTVTGNGGGNTLDGNGGENLFFGNLVLDTTDRTAAETFVSI